MRSRSLSGGPIRRPGTTVWLGSSATSTAGRIRKWRTRTASVRTSRTSCCQRSRRTHPGSVRSIRPSLTRPMLISLVSQRRQVRPHARAGRRPRSGHRSPPRRLDRRRCRMSRACQGWEGRPWHQRQQRRHVRRQHQGRPHGRGPRRRHGRLRPQRQPLRRTAIGTSSDVCGSRHRCRALTDCLRSQQTLEGAGRVRTNPPSLSGRSARR